MGKVRKTQISIFGTESGEIDYLTCNSLKRHSPRKNAYASAYKLPTKLNYRYPTYKLVTGNLYRYRPNPDIDTTLADDEDAWKLVVPEEHRSEVLRVSRRRHRWTSRSRKDFRPSSVALVLAALQRGNTGVRTQLRDMPAIQGRTTSSSRPHGTTRRREIMAGRSWGHY